MKAVVLQEQNQPLLVEELVLPDLGYGQVLVQVHSTTICGAQIGEITGSKGPDKYLPHLLGHEGCGEVLRCGPGVRHVKVHDRVVMHWRKGVGIDADPPTYCMNGSKIGAGPVATFAEIVVVSENRLTPIPHDIPPEVASLMGCAITTALGLINNEAQLKIGQSIAIAGVGGVGLNIIQGAKMVSASPIIAIDKFDTKLALANLFGATHALVSYLLWEERIHEIVGRRGVDVFVDCTGSPTIINTGFSLVAPGGKLILVGQPHAATNQLFFTNPIQHYCGKTVLDSQGGLTNPTVDIPRYCNLYREGKLAIDGMITHKYPLSKVNEAVAKVQTGQAGRVALEIN